jgi:hypothetical protein
LKETGDKEITEKQLRMLKRQLKEMRDYANLHNFASFLPLFFGELDRYSDTLSKLEESFEKAVEKVVQTITYSSQILKCNF